MLTETPVHTTAAGDRIIIEQGTATEEDILNDDILLPGAKSDCCPKDFTRTSWRVL